MCFLYCFYAGYSEVFVVKEWVKDARNDAKVEANLCAETSKALGAAE